MLVYHPSFDIYHTAYRILKVLYDNQEESIERERMRIIDFIILFPHDLHYIKIPRSIIHLRKKYIETNYNKVPDRHRIFLQIRTFFDTSIQCLISRGLLDIESYTNGLLKLNLSSLDDGLKIELERNDLLDFEFLSMIYENFLKLSTKELIERTSLIDNKYALHKN